ncbi:hypothetical protein [Bailinhaonella thermotolerans]|uniref:LppX_LprAFG lipoprotein n=1 Tax=Bailinhaonella thermotolerans TaxID=1070861 RepID=A0A3A4AN39_9ACTN|nr:hypothetical protein [Bailinhaonella thermotolerans]RJL22768.1 hypothetical protein D5H75_34835 [Bailinhaonella thermotolerans]
MLRPAKYVAAGAAALALAALTACGSQSPTATDGGAKPPAAASEAASSAPAAPPKATIAEVSSLMQKQMETHKSAKIELTMDAAGQSTKSIMAFSLASGTPEIDMKMNDPQQGEIRMVILKDALYMQTGKDAAPGKPWVKVSFDSKDPASAMFKAIGGAMSSSVKMAQNSELNAAGELVSSTQEKVGSTDTTHHTIKIKMDEAFEKIDIKKYIKDTLGSVKSALPPGEAAKLENETAGITDQQIAEVKKMFKGVVATYELWVDGQGLPVKSSMDMPIQGKSTKMDMVYSEWGKVTVQAPPADKTVDMKDVKQ